MRAVTAGVTPRPCSHHDEDMLTMTDDTGPFHQIIDDLREPTRAFRKAAPGSRRLRKAVWVHRIRARTSVRPADGNAPSRANDLRV